MIQTYLKYKITQDDIDRGRARGDDKKVGIVTTTETTSIVGAATTFTYEENIVQLFADTTFCNWCK